MSNLDRIKDDLTKLIDKSNELFSYLLIVNDKDNKDSNNSFIKFSLEYQDWYTEAYSIINLIFPDRLADFTIIYRDEKRKKITRTTYTICDFLDCIEFTNIDNDAVIPKFNQQMTILKSMEQKFNSSLFDIKQIIQADIFDSELDSSEVLCKKGFLRGAGAIAGVVLEKHLSEVCSNHNIKINKKYPTINDLNELLKKNEVIDLPLYRTILYLGDIRNICAHNKSREPKKEEVEDLIGGVKKITKTVY